MKLQILGLVDRKGPGKERLHLRVLADANLSFYMVADTTYTNPTAISNKHRHSYWFPSRLVKAGDHVVLYSGIGTESSKLNSDGTTSYFYYWGINQTIWNNTGDCAVLFELGTWQTSNFE